LAKEILQKEVIRVSNVNRVTWRSRPNK